MKTSNKYHVVKGSVSDILGFDNTASFDQSAEWYALFLKYFSSSEDAFMLSVMRADNESLVAYLFMVDVESSGVLNLKHLRALSNYYSSRSGIVFCSNLSNDEEKNVISVMVEYISNHFSCYSQIELEPLVARDFATQQLFRSLKNHGYWCFQHEKTGNWYHKLRDGGFNTFYSGLPSRLKNTVTRKEKRLKKAHDYTINIYSSKEDIARYLKDYEVVYEKSWKEEESHPEFIREFAINVSKKGWTRLGLLYVNNEPAAAQLWFVKDKTASIFKLSYDEYYKKLSVGSILTLAMMRSVIEVDNVREIDYLTGEDGYKKDWMSSRDDLIKIKAYNPRTLAGLMLGVFAYSKFLLKALLKKLSRK